MLAQLGLWLVVMSTVAFFGAAWWLWMLGFIATFALLLILKLTTIFSFILWPISIVFMLLANISSVRQSLFTNKVFPLFKKVLPPLSSTEQEALEAGEVWLEANCFQGNEFIGPLLRAPAPKMTQEEHDFLENEVNTLCAMLDDFHIVHDRKDLPPEVWAYIKKAGFLGLIIPKSFGGKEFGATAHSCIVAKVGTRSASAAVSIMVPNSLGPAELLLQYGTPEQKDHYLPRLASGQDIPCFALTSPEAGSDAGAIPDYGIVCYGMHEGREVLGMRITWDKRYITLAPVATVLGLAFKLYDPDHLLGDTESLGITLCLIPTDHPGVIIGRRHIPLDLAFMNGPTQGNDVFVPMDWVIGGIPQVGKGWKMLMACLAAGRGISLPALSTAIAQGSLFSTSYYASIRKQFKVSIAKFEGIEEGLAKIAAKTYQVQAMRLLVTSALDQHMKPAVVTAIAKYHMTELAREICTAAMDIQAGKGIILGPRNYIGRGYQSLPISITVEGANILTRNLIIYGQGAIRCHPYVLAEMLAAQNPDEKAGLKDFDRALAKHIGYTARNKTRTLVLGLSCGYLARGRVAPIGRYIQKLSWMSSALAYVSDVAMLILGGDLKRKERLSARLGDVLSYLFLSSAVIKYYVDNQKSKEDYPFVQWCLEDNLFKIQNAFIDFFDNFPNRTLGRILKFMVFPWGRTFKAPSDALSHIVAVEACRDSALKERLTTEVYRGNKDTDAFYVLQEAFQKIRAVAPFEVLIQEAIKEGRLVPQKEGVPIFEVAYERGIIDEQGLHVMREAEKARKEVIKVDDFPFDLVEE